MSYIVDVQSTRRYPLPFARAVAAAANEAMTFESVSNGAAVTLLLTDEEYIRELNRQFRDEDYSTDVLSFPAGEPMPGMRIYLNTWGILRYPYRLPNGKQPARGMTLSRNSSCWRCMVSCTFGL